jgi:hypothetical protein
MSEKVREERSATYLGNGVYVDVDVCGELKLYTDNGIKLYEIYLDKNAWNELSQYVERLDERANVKTKTVIEAIEIADYGRAK